MTGFGMKKVVWVGYSLLLVLLLLCSFIPFAPFGRTALAEGSEYLSFTSQVASSNGGVEVYVPTLTYSYNNDWNRVGRYPNYADVYEVGASFEVTLPVGATVTSGTFGVWHGYEVGNPLIGIKGQDNGASPSLDQTAARTTASSYWSSYETGWQTKDVTSIVQELYASYDYTGGGNIILWQYVQSAVAGHNRQQRDFDYLDGDYGPQLTIEYTLPSSWDAWEILGGKGSAGYEYSMGRGVLSYDYVNERMYCLYAHDPWGLDNTRIYLACSEDEGEAWTHREVTTDNEGTRLAQALAVDGEGTVHMVWTSFSDDLVFYREMDSSFSFGSIETISDDREYVYGSVSLAVDADDNVHVVWSQSDESNHTRAYHNVKYWSGWSGPEVASGPLEISEPVQMAVDIGGDAHLVCIQEVGVDEDACVRHFVWDGSWGEGETVYALPQGDGELSGFSIAVDGDGTLHLLVTAYLQDTDDYVLMHYEKVLSGSWAVVDASVDAAEENDDFPGIVNAGLVVDQSGVLHAVYNRAYDTAYLNVYGATYTTSWSSPVELLGMVSSLMPVWPLGLWATHPDGSSVPEEGYAFAFTVWDVSSGDPLGIWFYKSSDLDLMEYQVTPGEPSECLTGGRTGDIQALLEAYPTFSAIYNGTASATYYQIQVDDDEDFGSPYWDTGQVAIGYSLTDGERSQDVTYGGPDLVWHVPYYWRIRFWNVNGVGEWGHPMFILNHAPSPPEHLRCEGLLNPTEVEDPTPEFTAMYVDDDGAAGVADYYQLQVGTDNDWAAAEMWDSTQTALSMSTAEHDWCEDIVYAGSDLDGSTTYYWRIKFWDDDGAEGEWSTDTSTFTMTGTPVVTTTAATGISGSGATLNGSLVYDTGENCEYGFLYGYSATDVTIAVPWSGSGDTKNTGETFSSTLSGIDYGETVYFKAMCRNAGSTGYGSVMSFTTLAGAAAVSTQYATDVSTSTAALEGYLLEDGGEVCEVSFQWGTTGECWGWTESNSTYESYDDLGVGVTLAQTFTVDAGGSVDAHAVALKVYREGTPGDMTVEIWTTTGSVPDTGGGSLEATGTFDGNSLTSDAIGEWIVVSFGSPCTLSASTLYAIVVEVADGDSSNKVFWLADDSGGVYGSGDFCSKTGAGAWGTVASTTGMFAVFDDYSATSWLSGYTEGSNFTETLTGLDVATVYRFRARANNTSGTVYGSDRVFLTAVAAAKPTGLRASPLSDTQISLTWTKGYGAYHTLVRYKAYGYPTGYSDGEVAYLGDSSSQLVTGLTPGTTYYFAAWSVVPGAGGNEYLDTEPANIGSPFAMDAGSGVTTVVEGDLGWMVDDYYIGDEVVNVTRSLSAYVEDYDGGTTTLTLASPVVAQVPTDEFYITFVSHAVGTTRAGSDIGEDPYVFGASGSSNWFLEPSDSAMSFLPGRGVIVDAAGEFGMGVGNMFFFLAMLMACGVGFFVFLLSRSILGMVIGLAVFFLLCMVLGVVPGWIFVMWLLLGFGGGFALNKGLQV